MRRAILMLLVMVMASGVILSNVVKADAGPLPREVRMGTNPTGSLFNALGAGLGMGILNTSLLYPCVIIGITAGVMTLTGMKLGGVVSSIIGSRMEAVAGVVLILLSMKMLTM